MKFVKLQTGFVSKLFSLYGYRFTLLKFKPPALAMYSDSSIEHNVSNNDYIEDIKMAKDTCCGKLCSDCVWNKVMVKVIHEAGQDKEKISQVLNLIEDEQVKEFVKFEVRKWERLRKEIEEN